MRHRLAVIATHPVQYIAPWLRYIAAQNVIDLKVFYCWNFGVTSQLDRGFGERFEWDVPLLDGYQYEFVENASGEPGSHRFFGIRNPQLRSRVLGFNPSAVLMIGYQYASFLHFLARSPRSLPLLFRGDSHDLGATPGTLATLKRAARAVIYRKFAACLYVGAANHDYFVRSGVDERRLFFAPHAVDHERFAAEDETRNAAAALREQLGIEPHQKVVLFAGKLEEKKQPLQLLRAFGRSAAKDAVLLFVGSGPLKPALEQAATAATVRFLPFQNQSRMPAVYRAADLFVLPSYGRYETWGVAVNEAAAAGLPIIVSDHVGCAGDLVRHGENGLIFPAGDEEALTVCLDDALRDQQRLKQWSAASRAIAQRFSYETATAGLFRALEFAVGNVGR